MVPHGLALGVLANSWFWAVGAGVLGGGPLVAGFYEAWTRMRDPSGAYAPWSRAILRKNRSRPWMPVVPS